MAKNNLYGLRESKEVFRLDFRMILFYLMIGILFSSESYSFNDSMLNSGSILNNDSILANTSTDVFSDVSYHMSSTLDGENIILSLNRPLEESNLDDSYYLMMLIEGQSYRYFGKLIFPITIVSTKEADYTFLLIDKSTNNVISISEISTKVDCSDLSLKLESLDYYLDEEISIELQKRGSIVYYIPKSLSVEISKISGVEYAFENQSNFSWNDTNDLRNSDNNYLYKFSGTNLDELIQIEGFYPKETGVYKFLLKCDGAIISSEMVRVLPNDYSDQIIENMSNDSIFVDSIIESSDTTDYMNNIADFKTEEHSLRKMTLKNSRGDMFVGDVKVYGLRNITNSGIKGKIMSIFSSSNSKEVADKTEISLSGIAGLDEINLSLNNMEYSSNSVSQEIYIEKIDKNLFDGKNSVEIDSKDSNGAFIDEDLIEENIIDVYAVDLSNLKFTNGTLTKTAKGRELWKCKDWIFSEQKCYGTWTKVSNIIPGEPYDIEVSPVDPGYIETGLATINTEKSVYKQNETAKIWIVVLDTNGYLVSNASLNIQIMSPNIGVGSTTYFYDNSDIIEIENGIYELIFPHTYIEGNYTMHVEALNNLGVGFENPYFVNYTMSSQFLVQNDYDFEILRTAPVTIDPYRGPFYSKITINPLIDIDGTYDLTEKLPIDVIVSDYGNALLYNDSANQYLRWEDLNSTSVVSYRVQAPLVTPALLVLGKAFIDYIVLGTSKVFEEFRNWFIAVDPAVTRDQGLLVYGERTNEGIPQYRNWTGSLLQAETSSGVNLGDRIDWLKLRCMRDFEQCLLLVKDRGNDVDFIRFNTSSWTWSTNTVLATAPSVELDSKDVECEDVSGHCLLVYENNTGANTAFAYRIWNGTGLSSETGVSVTGGENLEYDWIRLYPRDGTDQMGIGLQNSGGGANSDTPGMFAGIWNGTAFGNWQVLTTVGPSDTTTTRTFYKHFDCAWDGNGNFFCFYANNSLNSILSDRWNGTAWAKLGRIYNTTGEPREFSACGVHASSDFNHTLIGLMVCDENNDLDGGIWNISRFSKNSSTQNPAQNINAECGDANKGATEYSQNFQCVWEDDGSKALFVWVNNGVSYLTSGSYIRATNSFSNINWTVGTQIVANGAGALRSAYLVPNPADNSVFLVYTDGARDGGCSYWSGTSWDGSGCNSATVFETNGATAGRGWMTFDWFRNPPPQPAITIISPSNTIVTKNYTGITSPSSTHKAWDNGTTALPPTGASAPISGVELSSANYVKIISSNDVRHTTTVSGAPTGRYAYQSFNFSVTESTVNMKSITLTHEGYATQTTGLTASQFYIYGYNWSSDSYVLLKTVFASAVDVTSEVTISSGFNDFVRNRHMYVLVEGSFAIGAGGNARADINTDYIGLTIESIPMLSRNVSVNATAIDEDGVNFCEWRFYNSTGGTASNLTRMSSTGGNYYFNTSGISFISDGFYDLTVLCNDTLTSRTNESVYVYVDNTAPNIILYGPSNDSNITSNSAIFSWNVTDIVYSNMLCNITIDGAIASSNIVSAHSENTTKNITSISDGTHYWNISCSDDAGNVNTSQTWRFDSDTAGPTVTLNNPSSASYVNQNPLDLNFTATDSHAIINCSIYLDGVLNTTLYSLTSGAITNVTLSSLSQGLHRWNVTCYDSFQLRGNSTTRNFTYDITAPRVYLNISNGHVFNGTTPILNYTVVDNIDTSLRCNITVNSVIEDSNIVSANNTLISRTIPLLDGFKQWNVTCIDDAGNVNASENRLFQVVGGPIVNLQTPVNGTIGNGTNISFKYYAQDGNGIYNCSLYLNQVLNQTNNSITNGANNTFIVPSLNEGIYNWSVTCYDTNLYPGYSSTWQIISDRSKPLITLSAPSSGQVLTTTPAYFNFTFTDSYSRNATCNLTIDNVVSVSNQNFIAINGNITTRSQTVGNGIHYWNVTCIDQGLNFNTSLTWNFTVNVTFPINVTVLADKTQYQEGETAYINITTRNSSLAGISANITIDYIYTNKTYTDIPWWNTSWMYRKPIIVNQTNNTLISEKAILLNVSVPYGTITNCRELRVVSDSDLTLVDFGVITGDDVLFCYIYFIGTVTANAVNQNNYHVYYGNPSATYNSQYSYISNNRIIETLFYDDFSSGSITSNWTVSSGWDVSSGNPLTGNHAHIQGTVTNANVRLTTPLNLSKYDAVNLSFTWGINGNWDAGEFLRYDYSNDSSATWSANSGIDSLDGGSGATTQTVNTALNNSYKVNGFNVRFRATNNNANEDGGFDNVNITGYFNIQSSVVSGTQNQQIFISRISNTTNASGRYNTVFSTSSITYGNYSAVAYAYPPNLNLRAGWGYDYFDVIADQFGPVITLLYPNNATTFRSLNMTFNYTAVDYANTVNNCSLYLNGIFNQSNSTINESITNTFNSELFEGQYYWYINCFDSLGAQTNSSRYVVTIDDTPPSVIAISPSGNNLPSGTITFNFNVTDNFDTSIFCNLTVDSGNYSRIFNTSNGINSTTITNVTSGFHYWNMSCFDNVNNNASSLTLNFTTVTVPVVYLNSPANGSGINATNISLYYNLSSSNVANCSLILNSVYNQTANSSQIPFTSNNGQNNFTLTDMNYGIYTWTVICFDVNNFNGTDSTRIFHLDNAAPIINLNYPSNNQTIFSRNINFTFNVSDVDDILLCNLTIDGAVNKTNQNISSNITGKIGSMYVTGLSITNHTWSVSCIDNTGFMSVSETRNFTIDSSVSISLTSPSNNHLNNTGSVNFVYIPSSPADFNLGFCDLYIDGSIYSTHVALVSGSSDTFAISGIGQGIHNWAINCTDSVSKTGASETRNFTIDLTSPVPITYYPNGHNFTNGTVFFNWSVTDNFDTNMTCTVNVNGTSQSPTVASLNDSLTNRTYSGFRDGLLFWNVTCIDDAGNRGSSSMKNFTIFEAPIITLNAPANNNRTRNQNITFYYTPTDNSGNISSCSILLDGVLNQTNSTVTSSGVQKNFRLNNIIEGYHNWSVNCSDPSGNIGYSSNYSFYIDLYPPIISLGNPYEGEFLNTNNVPFRWNATDYSGTTINCSIYIDSVFRNSTTKISGVEFNMTVYNLTDGPHTWLVNCSDNLFNSITSETRNFTINQPDLYIIDSKVLINNTNPNLFETINITANVSNIGGVPANNIFVDFWDGIPGIGTYIGNDSGTVGINGSRIFSVSWNITEGFHNLYVIVDPYNLQGELNESNNNATKNISVLRSNINSPFNSSAFNNQNVTFDFTLQDYSLGQINYSVYVNGIFTGQNGTTSDNVSTSINITLSQGLSYVQIQATDLSFTTGVARSKNSSRVYVTVDYTAPIPVINTINNSWFNYSTPQLNFSATDNIYTNISYILYVNGTQNINGSLLNGTSIRANLTSLVDGYYQVILEAFDYLNNSRNSTAKYIYVDTIAPTINLLSPSNNQNFTNRTVILNYSVYDNLATTINCSLVLDGVNVVNQTVGNGNYSTYTATNLGEGIHYWNVSCQDTALNFNFTQTQSFNVFIGPNITLISPQNNYWSNILANTFYFNVTDETGIENCSILINGVINATKTNNQITNNGQNNLTVTFESGGNYTWRIECYDNTTYHTYSQSTNRTILVDVLSPMPYIMTLNNSWFRNATPLIQFNITDNMDTLINYTFFVNDSINSIGNVSNATISYSNLQGLTNGSYSVILEGVDEAGNRQNSTPIIIFVDTVRPNINLTSPLNNSNLTTSYTSLNFTVTDNMANYLICNVTLDSTLVGSNINITSGQTQNISVSSLNGGYHYWNVTCYDQALNFNNSLTYRFYVQMPDLYVNSSKIILSNNNPIENETINITATIENIGNIAAFNFITQIWTNNSGILNLIYNQTMNLSSLNSTNITANYTLNLGNTTFNVYVDTPLLTNGIVSEEDEQNNNALRSIYVSLWEYVMGTTNAQIALVNNMSIYEWIISNESGSNLFVSDFDSNINWFSLQALGRNMSNGSSTLDFSRLDSKLNSTLLSDSINRTYLSSGQPIELANYTVFRKIINNIPVINSTNNSNFKTGLLWDYGDGGISYNGTQDVVLISRISKGAQGYNGTVDYEIRIPATLRSYLGSTNQVAFYAEIR